MKLVCVTGISRGLGFAITKKLLSEGYHVVGISRSQTNEVNKLLKSNAGYFNFETFDLELDNPSKLFKKINSEFGYLYGLVNNAAIGLDGVLATMHDSEIEKVMCVNLTNTILFTKYAIRSILLNEQKTGRIINISSIIAKTGFNGLSVYAASKAGLIGFTKSLARELGRANICVNAILPGYMQTDMSKGIKDENLRSIIRRSPLKKLVNIKDVSHMVSYLISDKAQHITGASLTVDAGSTS